MKKLKILGAIAFTLIGGGALASVPIALTSCKGSVGGGDNDGKWVHGNDDDFYSDAQSALHKAGF